MRKRKLLSKGLLKSLKCIVFCNYVKGLNLRREHGVLWCKLDELNPSWTIFFLKAGCATRSIRSSQVVNYFTKQSRRWPWLQNADSLLKKKPFRLLKILDPNSHRSVFGKKIFSGRWIDEGILFVLPRILNSDHWGFAGRFLFRPLAGVNAKDRSGLANNFFINFFSNFLSMA